MRPPKTKKRLFLALWPDEAVRQKLSALLQNSDSLLLASGSPVKAENLHLTLLFLGDVSHADTINLVTALDSVSLNPFTLSVNRWGHFAKPGILWLGVTEIPDALKQLYKQLQILVPKTVKGVSTKDFKPHITIIRNINYLPEVIDFKSIKWEINGFSLVESKLRPEGVEYTVLHQWGDGQ